ncbi:hypothetical protein D9615_000958 [Tricholomella constricta]|uniref:MARVEL domain-containing protein n=1 Tax=Tricholomella constricta TaxID=117010 RepID=A0A8H5HKS3_9AGAR|nr:hypothetical protein D9615_000958 [Tricholomella constricta]
MAVDDHIRRGHPILFGLLLVFSIIEMSISAWLTSRFNAHHNYRNTSERDRVRYALFASIWTIIGSSLFLILFIHSATGSIMTSVAAHLIFLILTWIIWIAAAASISAMVGGGLNCPTQTIFVYCGQLNALQAFAWIIWILVTFMLIVVIFRGISAARRGDGYRGGLVV